MKGYLDHLVSRALDAAPVIRPRLPSWFEPLAPPVAMLQEVAEEQVMAGPQSASPPLASPMRVEPREAARPSRRPEDPPWPSASPERTAQALHEPGPPPAIPLVSIEREIHKEHKIVIERRIVEEKPAPKPLPETSSRVEPREPAAFEKIERDHVGGESLVQPPSFPAPVLGPVSPSVPTVRDLTTPVVPVRPASAQQRENQPSAVAALVPKPVPSPAFLPLPSPEAGRRRTQEQLPSMAEEPAIRVSIGRVDVRAVFAAPAAAAPRPLRAAPMLSLDDYLKQKDGRVA